MIDFVAALGKSRNSAEVQGVLGALAPLEIEDDPPGRQYAGSPAMGVDVLLENDRVISVQIFLQPTRRFAAYADALPLGVQPGMTQAEVHRALGEPVESDEVDSRYQIGSAGAVMIVTFDDDSRVELLSLELRG